VTFSVAVLRKLEVKARKVGLHVSYSNRFITSLGGDEKDHAEIIAKNLNFPVLMRNRSAWQEKKRATCQGKQAAE